MAVAKKRDKDVLSGSKTTENHKKPWHQRESYFLGATSKSIPYLVMCKAGDVLLQTIGFPLTRRNATVASITVLLLSMEPVSIVVIHRCKKIKISGLHRNQMNVHLSTHVMIFFISICLVLITTKWPFIWAPMWWLFFTCKTLSVRVETSSSCSQRLLLILGKFGFLIACQQGKPCKWRAKILSHSTIPTVAICLLSPAAAKSPRF